MSKKTCIMILALLVGAGIQLTAQTKLREVIQTTQSSKVFAVPLETDLSELTNYDFTKMMSTDKLETKQKYIDKNQYLNVVINFPQLPRWENDYEFEVGKAEINKTGTKLYDHEGKMIFENADSSIIEDYYMDNKEISNYGFNPTFDLDIRDLAKIYESMGFLVKISDNSVLSAISDTLEFYYDYKKLISETRVFEDTLLMVSDWQQFQKIDKYYIPKIYVMTTYDILSTGARLQVCELTDFLGYGVYDSNGKPIVEFNSGSTRSTDSDPGKLNVSQFEEVNKKNCQLTVYPNPSSDFITVNLPYFASDYLDLEILNTQGAVIFSEKNIESGGSITTDISSFNPGLYLVRCGKSDKWVYTKLVKQ